MPLPRAARVRLPGAVCAGGREAPRTEALTALALRARDPTIAAASVRHTVDVEGLVGAFWRDESTPFVRRMILDEAIGKVSGATRCEFNVFALTLDFDTGLATVEDLLAEGQRETVELRTFLDAAAAFYDDPAEGDGLTEAERHPPSYAVDPHGRVQRVDE